MSNLVCLPFSNFSEVVFHLKQKWSCLSLQKLLWSAKYNFFGVISKPIYVIFHLQKNMRFSSQYNFFWGRLPFTNLFEVAFHLQFFLRLSSIYNFFGGCLPFTHLFRSSSIYKSIWGRLPFTIFVKVVFHLQICLRSSSI